MGKSLRSRQKTPTAKQMELLLTPAIQISAPAISKECMKNFGKQWKQTIMQLLKSFLNLTTSKKVTYMTRSDNLWSTKPHSLGL
jgi:hypothetical protein